jgi:hypothetical protein
MHSLVPLVPPHLGQGMMHFLVTHAQNPSKHGYTPTLDSRLYLHLPPLPNFLQFFPSLVAALGYGLSGILNRCSLTSSNPASFIHVNWWSMTSTSLPVRRPASVNNSPHRASGEPGGVV